MSDSARRARGVQLPADTTASGLLHRLLVAARDRFESLAVVDVPEDPRVFRRTFGNVLPLFEAARAAAADRSAIARRMTLEAAGELVYCRDDGSDVPLAEHLAGAAAPLPVEVVEGTSNGRLGVCIPLDDGDHRGDEADEVVSGLADAHHMTRPAAEAIRWAIRRGADGLDLSGMRFAVLGAAAELAPTRLLLRAGADVLWIDIKPPDLRADTFSGRLHVPTGGADLLTQPAEIVATIEAFAGQDPVHIGMFAYAAGEGREWRLESAMNAIARALPRDAVASVGIYVSPTSAAVVDPLDVAFGERRREQAPRWQRALGRAGALGPPVAEHREVAVSRAIVPIQGASYQAAQYIAKSLVAEAFATSKRVPVVSANVAGITNTGSMGLPVFQAAFLGAAVFGVRIFRSESTRWLSGLLLLHDILNDDARPAPDDPAALFTRQIHGGVHAMAWSLDDAIKFASVYGFARRPRLLLELLR
jgi:hypothetical protein